RRFSFLMIASRPTGTPIGKECQLPLSAPTLISWRSLCQQVIRKSTSSMIRQCSICWPKSVWQPRSFSVRSGSGICSCFVVGPLVQRAGSRSFRVLQLRRRVKNQESAALKSRTASADQYSEGRMFALRIALVFIALGFVMENHSQIRPRHSLVFEAASASAEEPARFVARAPGYTALLSTEGVTFATGQSSIRMVFVGANPNASLVGQEHLETRVTYILGEDPATWRTNVPTYSKVQLRNAYPWIDVVYYSSQGHLEYDFVVNPGADAGLIHLAIEGARQLSTDSAGDLVMTTSDGEFHQRQPQAHQLHKHAAREVRGRYVLGGERNVSLAVDNYDRG